MIGRCSRHNRCRTLFSGKLPHIDNLYYAVATVEFQGVHLSATGLGDSIGHAEMLRDAEIAERKSMVLFGTDTPGPEVTGTAAGPDPDQALINAMLEAVERHASHFWWTGDLAAAKPTDDDLLCLAALQKIWRRSEPRQVGLLDITHRHGLPVFVAWSCSDDGRDLCFGTACRMQRGKAIQAALKELHQMEFGLDIVRYRQRHGVALSRRERIQLARSRRLSVAGCRSLLEASTANRIESPMQPPQKPSQLDGHLAAYGMTIHAAKLPRTDDKHWTARAVLRTLCLMKSSAGQSDDLPIWAKWDLY